jgi:hypothetical protein
LGSCHHRGVSTENSFSRYSCLCVLHGFCKITSSKLFKQSFLGRSHMGKLGAKTSQWRPVQVPYLPYPRYVTVRQKLELFGRPLRNQQHPTIKVQTFIVKTSRSKWRRKVGWVPSHQQGMGNSFYLLPWGFSVAHHHYFFN